MDFHGLIPIKLHGFNVLKKILKRVYNGFIRVLLL